MQSICLPCLCAAWLVGLHPARTTLCEAWHAMTHTYTHHVVFLTSLLVFYGPPTQNNKAPTTVWTFSVAARADKGPSSVCLHATHVHVKHEASLVGADYPIYIITLCVWNPVLLTHLALYKIHLIPFYFFVPKFNFFSICIYWNASRIPFLWCLSLYFTRALDPKWSLRISTSLQLTVCCQNVQNTTSLTSFVVFCQLCLHLRQPFGHECSGGGWECL